ncbi:hypothetical protein L3Q82_013699, partial [Scortum barcoo]
MYVPDAVRAEVLRWCHSTKLACHPGVKRTLSLGKRLFWWPTAEKDVRDYVLLACSTCARGKSTHTPPPAGLLRPLPIPGRPWSHIALDFATGLPTSATNTTILTIVDRFSKAAHFIALPKLPSARETADFLTSHVVRLHGIPQDVVSDRGPQFISRVWKEFCRGLGVTAGGGAFRSLRATSPPALPGHVARRTRAALEATAKWNQQTADKKRSLAPQYFVANPSGCRQGIFPSELRI